MNSILEEFRGKKLNYSAFSLSELSVEKNKYNVFDDNSYYFLSKYDPSDQWWQVSFQTPVSIDSYLIKAHDTWQGRIKSWIINVSTDNKTWETVDTVNDAVILNNNNKEKLDKTVTCKHFRIVAKANFCGNGCDKCMIFSYIDIFGKLSSLRSRGCTCQRRNSRISSFMFIFIYVFTHVV